MVSLKSSHTLFLGVILRYNEFGLGAWMWMFDSPMGFHQLAVALASRKKLAFQGVDDIKWTYTVMPFGPTNGPATFINFIHDLDSVWKEHALSSGIPIDDDTNTKIIVDDIVSWSRLLEYALANMRCQLKVCQAYHLSLTLRESHFFPKRFEFIGVGVDVCNDGNRPAQSKFMLLNSLTPICVWTGIKNYRSVELTRRNSTFFLELLVWYFSMNPSVFSWYLPTEYRRETWLVNSVI